ncbi:7TM-DISM domain-containing protein, partial [Vibrio alginolyticus]
YLVLSIARKNLVDFSYAMFILGNLLFNSTSLLVAHHLLGIQWFGGASWPILCSNMAYLVFVMQLLEVKSKETPMVYYVGCGLLVLFAMFFSASFFLPNWQNEFNRHAVGLFISFGMFAGIRMIFKGSKVARWYVLANLGFFVLAA